MLGLTSYFTLYIYLLEGVVHVVLSSEACSKQLTSLDSFLCGF